MNAFTGRQSSYRPPSQGNKAIGAPSPGFQSSDFMLQYGPGSMEAGQMSAVGNAFSAPQTQNQGFAGQSSMGGEGDGEGFTGFDISRLSNDDLMRNYASQNNLVGMMGTPGGLALRGLAGMALPGLGALFGMMQGPILNAYQNELARRGLMQQAFQEPASGNWSGRDARAFDLGFYGIGANALNAPGGPLAGQSTSIFGGNPATVGSPISEWGSPSFGGESDSFDTSSYGDLGGLY